MDTSYGSIAENVQEALNAGQPVVALESTIISHGMPYPQNVETAHLVEATVRDNGAVPATIGIIGGRCIVGLSSTEIETLGVRGEETVKVSRRDLPVVFARKRNGATTVAATMIIAEMAGIPVFATGGIGGVHRGASQSFDISADLQELARTNVTVVSSGAKAILDIALTLEYLETHGVPVIGYQTDEMPAFYTRSSGCGLSCRADSPKEIAEILAARQQLGLPGGTVIANPIPEEHQMPADVINTAITTALNEMEALSICGKDTTPFLLAKIVELTGGSSLEANIHLVHNNAALAAQIAKELCFLGGN
jgi:pseudouridine-5'-phosphate glycosidase